MIWFIFLGIVIRNQQTRDLEQNRKLARKLLIEKLDQLINGDKSVASQKAFFLKEVKLKNEKRAKKLRQLKKKFKESINIKEDV